ncbi:MAG: repressor LexA [Nitrospira sp.]|nr:repressor LexA [Nitrospira sp.]
MTPDAFKRNRLGLGLTQQGLADQLKQKRLAIARYEGGTRKIPGVVEVALSYIAQSSFVPLAGIVAAGDPIEPIPQTERVEVPKSMLGRGAAFALRVKGTSMRDDGIFPGDVVVVHKQNTARNGETVIALLNGEATIKIYQRKAGVIELHPANEAMKPLIVKDSDALHIEGVVVGVIRHLRR